MKLEYEDVPRQVQAARRRAAQDRAFWRAFTAEQRGSEDIAGLVRILRQRGRVANARSLWVLGVLLLTIVAGLVFYLGLPFWQNYVDGRRLTLLETRGAALAEAETLRQGRDTLRNQLAAALSVTAERVTGDWSDGTVFRGATPAGDGALLVWGGGGGLVRYDIATGTAEALSGDWSDITSFDGATPAGDGALLVRGNAGALVRYDIATSAAEALSGGWSDSTAFGGATPAGDGALLVWGDEVALVLVSDRHARRASELQLTRSDALLEFIKALPEDVRVRHGVPTLRELVSDNLGQSRIVDRQLAGIEEDIDGLWTGLLPLEQQRENFAGFMETCRGPAPVFEGEAERAADPLTLACLQGWQAEKASETQTWWATLAEQVPPGILLLFLLATLGGLYRYNLRLAGFHHSRADLLELLSMGGRGDRLRLGEAEMTELARFADVLAADKVEFGKANTPSDQAVEMFRAFMARGKG